MKYNCVNAILITPNKIKTLGGEIFNVLYFNDIKIKQGRYYFMELEPYKKNWYLITNIVDKYPDL
jgi:hypothetical protein